MSSGRLPSRFDLGAWASPFVLWVTFLLALGLIAASVVLDIANDRALAASNANVARTLEALEKVRQTTNAIYVAESAQHNYILTHSPAYLATYKEMKDLLPKRLAESAALISDDPVQRANLDRVRAAATRRFAEMDASIQAAGASPPVAAPGDEGTSFFAEARSSIQSLLNEEGRLLQQRRGLAASAYLQGQAVTLASNAVIAFALIAFYLLMRRNLRERDMALEALERSNAALERRVTERTNELSQLSRHLLNVREGEKKSIARDLHDEFGSYLTAINMDVSRVRDKIAAAEPEQSARLDRTLGLLNHAIEMKRRLISDLRPSILDNLGLGAALEQYIDDWSRYTGISTTFRHEGDLDTAEEGCPIAIFRVFQEAMNNVAKHSQATEVVASIRREGDQVVFEIADDGIGISDEARSRPGTHGLLGIRERVLAYNGHLEFARGPRGGTVIRASVVCRPATVRAPTVDAEAGEASSPAESAGRTSADNRTRALPST